MFHNDVQLYPKRVKGALHSHVSPLGDVKIWGTYSVYQHVSKNLSANTRTHHLCLSAFVFCALQIVKSRRQMNSMMYEIIVSIGDRLVAAHPTTRCCHHLINPYHYALWNLSSKGYTDCIQFTGIHDIFIRTHVR